MNELTPDEAGAILAIKNGADIYSYELADSLRGIQRRGLPVTDFKTNPKADPDPRALFHITKPMQYKGDGTDTVPYFGAIATKVGIKAARMALRSAK